MDKKYIQFIADLKQNIVQSRYIAARLVNKEQLLLYFRMGFLLSEKLEKEIWGTSILKSIAKDLQNELPGLRGFSDRNLYNMKLFYEAYQVDTILQSTPAKLQRASINNTISQSLTAKLNPTFFDISFTHHLLLLNKCKDIEERLFYMALSATEFWSVSVLEHKIDSNLYKNQGKLPNNFSYTLSKQIKPSALRVFRDEYLFDFMSLEDGEEERVLEDKVVTEIKNFILRMGTGFSFIGNQYRVEVGGEEFFIDLLFFNRCFQSLVAFELKRGKFKPEYAGKLNFYLNVLDDQVKLPHENPSIGIILCKEKNNTIVEISVRTIDKAMGVATYRTSKKVPKEIKGILPNAEDLAKLL